MIGLMSLVKLLVVRPYVVPLTLHIGRLASKFGVVGTFAIESFNPILVMHKKTTVNTR